MLFPGELDHLVHLLTEAAAASSSSPSSSSPSSSLSSSSSSSTTSSSLSPSPSSHNTLFATRPDPGPPPGSSSAPGSPLGVAPEFLVSHQELLDELSRLDKAKLIWMKGTVKVKLEAASGEGGAPPDLHQVDPLTFIQDAVNDNGSRRLPWCTALKAFNAAHP